MGIHPWPYPVCPQRTVPCAAKHSCQLCNAVTASNEVPAAVQVVHHPTVVAMHGEGESWSYEADADVRAKFWGRSVELVPVGLIRLKFDDGDEYQWAKVGSCYPTS